MLANDKITGELMQQKHVLKLEDTIEALKAEDISFEKVLNLAKPDMDAFRSYHAWKKKRKNQNSYENEK